MFKKLVSRRQTAGRKPSRLKRVLGRALLVVSGLFVGLLLAEILAACLMMFSGDRSTRAELVQARRSQLLTVREEVGENDTDATPGFVGRYVLHPLFGYTLNPKHEGINNFGFKTTYDFTLVDNRYVLKDQNHRDAIVVGVFGGSFAEQTATQRDTFEKRLAEAFPDKTPIVVNMALGGHALPQSAFIYLYFRDLFDVVVFLDGLNEVWNYSENNRWGVPPEYAKARTYRGKLSREELSAEMLDLTAQLIAAENKLNQITSLSLRPLIRNSVLVHTVWHWRHSALEHQIGKLTEALTKVYDLDEQFFTVTDDEILQFAAQQWGRYHELVDRTAKAEGVLAIHVLQPNPYVPGSKRLTGREKHRMTRSFRIESFVVDGYPKLQQELSKLHSQGLITEDLTQIYKDDRGQIWIDSAHANARGYGLVIERIVAQIKAAKEEKSWVGNPSK